MSSRSKGFSKSNRLTKAAEYQRVFDSSQRFTDKYFLILASQNELDIARLGLAISKKRLRSAVLRNRIKRLVRESFRENKTTLAGKDIVVLAGKGIATGDKKTLVKSLKRHWVKVSLCKRS